MTTGKPRRSPGEGGVYEYRLRSGEKRYYWKATIQVGHERKPVVRRGFKTRADAARDMREALKKSDDGMYADPGRLTVGEWLDTWVAGLRPSPTRDTYEQMVRVTLKPRIADVKLAKLTSTRLTALYRELEESGSKRGGPLAVRSVLLASAVMSMALKAAVEAEPPLLARNPASRARPPRLKDVVASETVKAWSTAQLDAFLTWAAEHDPEHVALWYVAATTGMRRGELLALDWRDLTGDVISVYRNARPGPGGRPVLRPTKTRKGRTVDLDEETVAVLKAWRAQRGGVHLSLVQAGAPIFGNENGQRLTPKNVSAAFDRAVVRCRKALGEDELPRLSLHGLRHTMVTIWLTAGVPVKVVAERTGHTVATMLNTYAHVIPGTQAAAANQVAALRRQTAPASDEATADRPNLRVLRGKSPGQSA
ncbi:tyrosine-type recombinase/integrase [Streptomyces sp. B1-3]|uniref:tyrosine-type recombinase/integrase n=1 Tax=Streptomyces sp. B1-3 TaxID=3141453 RepID=UPI003D2680F8